ncbi:MAG: hypothetical protein Q8R69_18755 [Telluria sp.]|nr:hypothetical protein [Telluria sp.]
MNFNKKAVAVVAVGSGLLAGLVGSANAAIDASVGTAFTALQTDATSLSAIVVPIVVAVLGLVIVIKLIKRFGNKI